MGELAKLPNIGSVVEEQLRQVGITTLKQLEETGAQEAWLKIQAIDPSAWVRSVEFPKRNCPKRSRPN